MNGAELENMLDDGGFDAFKTLKKTRHYVAPSGTRFYAYRLYTESVSVWVPGTWDHTPIAGVAAHPYPPGAPRGAACDTQDHRDMNSDRHATRLEIQTHEGGMRLVDVLRHI